MDPNALLWKAAYRRHNAYVRSIIPKSQILEYRVTEVGQSTDSQQSLIQLFSLVQSTAERKYVLHYKSSNAEESEACN